MVAPPKHAYAAGVVSVALALGLHAAALAYLLGQEHDGGGGAVATASIDLNFSQMRIAGAAPNETPAATAATPEDAEPQRSAPPPETPAPRRRRHGSRPSVKRGKKPRRGRKPRPRRVRRPTPSAGREPNAKRAGRRKRNRKPSGVRNARKTGASQAARPAGPPLPGRDRGRRRGAAQENPAPGRPSIRVSCSATARAFAPISSATGRARPSGSPARWK